MRRLRTETEASLSICDGLDMLDTLDYKVFEDRELFDDASTATIREHFKDWTETASYEEQGTGPAGFQRYQLCIQVDSEALDSILYDMSFPPRASSIGKHWVKLIWRNWTFEASDWYRDGPDDPVEGLTVHEVGWSRVALELVMVSTYAGIRDSLDWDREYRRPPRVILL